MKREKLLVIIAYLTFVVQGLPAGMIGVPMGVPDLGDGPAERVGDARIPLREIQLAPLPVANLGTAGLRGLTLLWDALGLGVKALMFSAEVALEEENDDPTAEPVRTCSPSNRRSLLRSMSRKIRSRQALSG